MLINKRIRKDNTNTNSSLRIEKKYFLLCKLNQLRFVCACVFSFQLGGIYFYVLRPLLSRLGNNRLSRTFTHLSKSLFFSSAIQWTIQPQSVIAFEEIGISGEQIIAFKTAGNWSPEFNGGWSDFVKITPVSSLRTLVKTT